MNPVLTGVLVLVVLVAVAYEIYQRTRKPTTRGQVSNNLMNLTERIDLLRSVLPIDAPLAVRQLLEVAEQELSASERLFEDERYDESWTRCEKGQKAYDRALHLFGDMPLNA